MNKIRLTTKISVIIVVVSVISIVLLGFYFDTFLKNNYIQKTKTKISYAKENVILDFKNAEDDLKNNIDFIKNDLSFIASVELINNYQDKDNYNSILLDEEKKDITKALLEKVKISFNSNISLYDSNMELISYVNKDTKGYKLNFISYENSKIIVYSKYENDKTYTQNNYVENPKNPFKHIDYYTQKKLKISNIVTYHYVDNEISITSHSSLYYKDNQDKTLTHIEMSKTFDKEYFNKISHNLNLDIFISKDTQYKDKSLRLFENKILKDSNIQEEDKNYFSTFSISTKNNEVYILFSLDKSLLNKSLYENRKQLSFFLFISIIIILTLFNYLLRYGISTPIQKLMNQITKIKHGDYSESSIVQTADELEDISVNINMLASSVKSREQKLEYLSTHDELTNLLNRRSFSSKLKHTLELAKKENKKVAVLFLDLDQFKQINDTLGHTAGDNLLKLVANRIQLTLEQNNILARVGGDEFNIFTKNYENIEEIRIFAQKILDCFKEPFSILEHSIVTSTTIGISIFPDDGLDSETLIKNADLAMYIAKDEGRNGYVFYSSNFSNDLENRINIIQALKLAIKNQNEFILYYQPKISIKTQKIIAVEALIRWNSSELGFTRPDQFIAIAEETHMIIDIGEWIIKQACKDFILLRDNGYKLQQISVNVSGVQLQYSDMVKTVKEILSSLDISADSLEIEVTESYIATNEEKAIETLAKFRDMGIELAIDDFGTGYSSMSYLQKLPITRLKIDKSFVDDIPHSSGSVALVNAVIALAQAFNLKITVEGVELEEQLNFFKDKYCDDIQGYFYSKPLPLNELKEFIKNNS